jgi:hypothetical protein
MIVQQGIIASSLQNLLTKTVRSLNDYSVMTYTLCSFSAPEGQVPYDWFGFTETSEFASTTYSLCSFSISEDELSASNLGFVFVSDKELLTNFYEMCSFSVPTNELTNAYPASSTDAIKAFRTSIYGVSSNVISALNIISPDRVEFSYWETTTDGVNYSIVSDYQTTTLLYAYLSGNSLPHDASVMNVSARHVVGYNFYSYKSLPVALKPYSNVLDIPNLQAWFDSSDSSYVTTQVTYPSADGNTKILTLQDSTLIDRSPNNLRFENFGVTFSYDSTLNSYFGNFNGSSRIEVENILGSNFLNNDYTIEFWVYGGGNAQVILTISLASINWYLSISSNRPRVYNQHSGGVNYTGGTPTALIANQWNHIALVKTGNVHRFFTNGNPDTSTGSQTAGITVPASTRVTIGCRWNGSTPLDFFSGSISNLRIYSGGALYTAPGVNVVPTPPLSSITSPNAVSQLRVVNWRDKSLNSLSATINGAMNRFTLPSYRNSGLPSGLSSLDFDGVDDTMEVSAPITISEDFTSIFVYERPYGGAISQTIGTSTAAAASPYLHWTNDYIYTGNDVLQSPIGFSGGTSGIGAVRKNEMFAINDPNWSWNTFSFTPLTVNWSGSNTSVSLNSIGRYNAISYHRGQYHEYIQAKCMLPDVEIQLVLSKLRDKWFIPTLAPQMITAPYISIGNYFTPVMHLRPGTWRNMSLDPSQPTDAYVIIAQKSFDGVNYTDIPGASAVIPHTYGASPALSYQPTNSEYGAYIRARTVVKNSVGSSPELYTNSYVLTAYNTSAPTLTRTSIWNVTVNPGSWYSTITIHSYYYKWEYTTNGGSTWQPLGSLTTNDTVSLSSVYTGTPIDVRVTVYPLTNITELPS